MPSKKKKYNARFPAGRIKKIMQSDEEIGKVAQAVPVIISRTLELFVKSMLTKTLKITNSRNAKTLSTSHMKQCIMAEQRFDFLRELVKNIPDISVAEEADANYIDDDAQSSTEEQYPYSDTPYDLSMPSTSSRATRNNSLTNGGSDDTNMQRTPPSHNGNNGGVLNYSQPYRIAPQYEEQRARLLKRDADMMQRLQRVASGNSSVIMHTTAAAEQANFNNDCQLFTLPAKLSRSDSTPTNITLTTSELHHNRTPTRQSRHALKQQALAVTTNNNNNNSSNKKACTPPKQQQQQPKPLVNPQLTQQLHKQTAIPAPIVSYDFCNKPIVKIDYSNLPIRVPLSAPANMHTSSTAETAFNFSADPIISIDLSNIVTNVTSTTATKATIADFNCPTVATISIGALTTTPIIPHSNSKASSTSAAAPFKESVIPNANSKSFFELDEDYDNI